MADPTPKHVAPTFAGKPLPAAPAPSDPVHEFKAVCVGGDVEMAKNLSRFPNLCHAPAQHGEGIRTHMKGVHVDAIALTAKQTGLVKLLDEVAISLDVDLDELCDAIRWARKEKAI